MVSRLRRPKVEMDLEVSGGPFYPGGTINVRGSIYPQQNFFVREGYIELVCTEIYSFIETYTEFGSGRVQRIKPPERSTASIETGWTNYGGNISVPGKSSSRHAPTPSCLGPQLHRVDSGAVLGAAV